MRAGVAVADGVVVAGVRPVTDTVKVLHGDTLGDTVDREALARVVSPVVVPADRVDGAAALLSDPGVDLAALAAKRQTPVTGLAAYPGDRYQLVKPKIGLYYTSASPQNPAQVGGAAKGACSGGYCEALRRTRVGPFDVADADPTRVIGLGEALAFLPTVLLDADAAWRAAHGQAVPGEAPDGGDGEVVLVDADGPVAIALPRDGTLKPVVGFRG